MSRMFLMTSPTTEAVETESQELGRLQNQSAIATEEIDLSTLFAPLTQEEVTRRLTALQAFETDTSTTTPSNKNVDSLLDAVSDSYEERASQLMEGHR